ncbi:MAG: phosphatase PAP2 family protein [Deltaproteobacteria bacterium]
MKYSIHVLVICLSMMVFSGKLHAEDQESFLGKAVGNIVEDFKYLATSPARLDTKSALIALGVIGVGGALYACDGQIRDYYEDGNHHSSALDDLAYTAEKLGYPWALGIVGIYGGTGYLMKNEKMKETALLSFESFLVANSISVSVKYATGRSRPKKDKGAYNYKPFSFDTSYTAFPSGHATSAFSIASVFASEYESPWVDVLAYGLACLSGWQRLYDDKHWASDVWFGAALGTVVGRSVVYLHKKTDGSVSLAPLVDPPTGSYGLCVQLRF